MGISTASITVIATNSTGQGNITFSTFNFLESGSLMPGSFPPIILPTLADGATATILQSYFQQQVVSGSRTLSPCSGTAIFNLPNGPALTITWNLSALNGGPMPSIVPGAGYYVSGATNPTISGFNYTFNINIQSQ
ncbi:hypothetical protein HHL17_26175 [Chitinophaga sp. G-6-1-13]|uniref:Uncharacterized protein n=1 Tax=Chitinophaga fulva TaxID=2728842 RepID=A0A848GU87_9BACT|nr:hypothetical protein [Chitinophaga fulva]NML40712.1 hypothetical protein [Chitinophaga fulva]